MMAAGNGDREAVEALVKAGAGVDLQDNGGCTAMMRAAVKGDREVVEMLLGAGARLDLQNKKGFTALTLVVKLVKLGSGVDEAAVKEQREVAEILWDAELLVQRSVSVMRMHLAEYENTTGGSGPIRTRLERLLKKKQLERGEERRNQDSAGREEVIRGASVGEGELTPIERALLEEEEAEQRRKSKKGKKKNKGKGKKAVEESVESEAGPSTIVSEQMWEERNKACVVCWEGKKDHVLIPCGHLCLCEGCCNNMLVSGEGGQRKVNGQCPVCRQEVSGFLRVFDT
jgi:hypothetical protein